MNYTQNFYLDKILQNAESYIETLSDETQSELKKQLNHGLVTLTTKGQLQMYIKSYGDIHRLKLLRCYDKIPSKVWFEGCVSIIDYGAGQGLAEIVLADFMKAKRLDIDLIKDITLIEPSRISLIQGVKYLQDIFINSKIKPILKKRSPINKR